MDKFKKKAAELAAKMTDDELIGVICYESAAAPSVGIHRYNWWNEASHGVARSGVATVFPCPTALAATFDPELLYRVGQAVSTEARAKYNVYAAHGEYDIYKGLTFWCPNVNIYRDPRWGRGQETFGEDPCLTSALAVSYIKGLQGDGEFRRASACAKHFAVHSGPESLRHGFDAKVSEKDLRETYLPAFKAAVAAGVDGIMGAYNRTNGEPCCASKKLSSILFDEWGFDGYFMSDNYALDDVHGEHGYTKDAAETAAAALNAGLVLDCAFVYKNFTKETMERGLVSRETVERAAAKTLEIRARLGEFEEERPYSDIDRDEVDSEEMRRLNLEAAKESLVLLECHNKYAILENKDTIKRIAVIGPNADSRDVLVGNYNGRPTEYSTVYGAMKEVFPDAAVKFAEGCLHITEDANSIFGCGDMISEGVEEARRADLTVVCLGLDATLEGEESQMENEVISGGDRKTIGLPATQKRLLHEVLGVCKNVVVVTFCGGSIDIGDEAREKALAHIHAWYPGARGGEAIARAIAGEYALTGKLPVTFYKEGAPLPDFTDYSMARRTRFSDPGSVLYPFGYGLTLAKPDAKVTSVTKTRRGVTVTVEAKNHTDKEARLPLDIYTNKGESIPERCFALCAVESVTLTAGERREISVEIPKEAYLPYGEDGRQYESDNEYLFICR